MTRHPHTLFKLITALLACVLGSAWASGAPLGVDSSHITTVTVRSTVRLQSDDGELTIGDFTTINGPQAAVIQSLTIDSNDPILAGIWNTIELSTIREVIDQSPTINAGSVVVVGSDVSITRRRAVSGPETTRPISTNTTENNTYEGPILQDHIERWIFTRLRTQADSTRIRFKDRNRELLHTRTADRVVEITQIGQSAEMHLRIVIYEADRIITDTTIRADVKVQRPVRVATKHIRRRTVIDQALSTIETRWLSPTLNVADPDTSLGLETKTAISPGEIILSAMITKPILIKRGQLVSAKSLVGQMIVTKVVRALEKGQMGDLIELESKDRKSHFTARVAGPGRVVIVVDTPDLASESSTKSQP